MFPAQLILMSSIIGSTFGYQQFPQHPRRQMPATTVTTQDLFHQVQDLITEKYSDEAFSVLMDVYARDPSFPGLKSQFESCLRLKIETDETDSQARFGLASLLLDQERFEEASQELQHVVKSDDPYIREKSASQLFRTNAAMCNWETVAIDGEAMTSSLRLEERTQNTDNPNDVPLVHPFEALKWPCISLSESTQIAELYARRSMASQGIVDDPLKNQSSTAPLSKTTVVGSKQQRPVPCIDIVKSGEDSDVSQKHNKKRFRNQKIRLGYLSPDFTAKHPMAFLIHSIFQHHNRNDFSVHVYSLASKKDDCPEVEAIEDGSDTFTMLPIGKTPSELADRIRQDDLDILIDLCGYTGTSKVAELLSHRPSDLQIAYMGFPASSGAPFIDYMIADQIVVPPSLREHYTEGMIWMPNCYFVNSHAVCATDVLVTDKAEHQTLREEYNLPLDSFVFCSHNRPDKIDYATFQVWLEALAELRKGADKNAVLWLLRSGKEMENNLRRQAREEAGLPDEALVFCDVAPREEHLRRLGCANVFLDTPSYNAHTVGCDTLFAGVPMISLLRPEGTQNDSSDPYFVPTEKLASRVGASLLSSVDLEELIASDLEEYKALMVKCASDKKWFRKRSQRLDDNRFSSALFDTERWVENLDAALRHLVVNDGKGNDVLVQESS